MAVEEYDVVIVGAGWYGLIAASTYLRLAPETNLIILDDNASIGGVWCDEKIYPNLFTQIGHGLFEYSSYPMKAEGLSPDRYISGKTVNGYLNDFAKDHGLVRRTRLNTRVTKVERRDDKRWRLLIKEGGDIIAEKMIYASGVSSEPYVPNTPSEGFDKPVIHSSQIGTSRAALLGPKTQRVTVVGAAKSAYDTVFLLLKEGKKVDWIIREEGRGSGPLAIMPPRLLGVLNTVDVMATRAMASFSPAILATEGVWHQFLHQTRIGRALIMFFWRSVARMAEQHAGYSKSPNAAKLDPIPHGYGIFWCNSGLGLASVPDFWKVFHAGDCTVHRTEIQSLRDTDTIVLEDGTRLSTDYLLLCTGWKSNLSTFDESLRAQIGLPSQEDFSSKWRKLDAAGEAAVDSLLPILKSPPDTVHGASERRPWRLYRRMVSPRMAAEGDRSVFFPGQVHSVFTPLVGEMQALWGAAFMLGMIDVPNQGGMETEVATWNAWTKKRYLEQGRKHAYSIYDYLAYIDTMAKDLGIRTQRKNNLISEMFAPYRPSDYRGLIDEFLASRINRAAGKGGMPSFVKPSNAMYTGIAFFLLISFAMALSRA